MPYTNSEGVKIYYEAEGQGMPLVLGHGGLGDMSMWKGFGYVDRLKDKYQVILMDSRGHGKSDKLYESSSYAAERHAADVVAVLDALQIDKAHYWGWSMNGFTAFALAKYYPQRILSLIIGGTTPYNTSDPNQPDALVAIYRRGLEEGVDAAVEGLRVYYGGSISPEFEQRIHRSDFRSMIAMLEHWEPGLEDVLPTMTMPCLIYIGDHDEPSVGDQNEPDITVSQEYVKLMPHASRFVLPGLNHAQTMSAIDLLLPRVLEFLVVRK